MENFSEGTPLASVTLSAVEGEEVWYTTFYRAIGYEHTHARSIVVVMEHGAMSMIPWAKVTLVSGVIKMVNLSMCVEVELMPKRSSDD